MWQRPLTDENGCLPEELSFDGVHLNRAGLRTLAELSQDPQRTGHRSGRNGQINREAGGQASRFSVYFTLYSRSKCFPGVAGSTGRPAR